MGKLSPCSIWGAILSSGLKRTGWCVFKCGFNGARIGAVVFR